MTDKNLPWYIHTVLGLTSPGCASELAPGLWVRSVCEPYTAGRFAAAWWVLTGRAFAFLWPQEGDLERAVGMDPPAPKNSTENFRPHWEYIYRDVAHLPDRDQDLVPVTRETLRIACRAMEADQQEEAYHNVQAAVREISMALARAKGGKP